MSSNLIKGFFFTTLFALLTGCTPKVGSSAANNAPNALPQDAAVLVVNLNRPLPDSCRLIGKLRAGGTSTNCHYDAVIADARIQARKMGGNILKITTYWEQGVGDPCYEIKANVFYSANADPLVAADQAGRDSLHRAKFGDHPDYAILYAYRPTGPGALIGFNLHLGDSVICRMTNYSSHEIRIYKEGSTTLWAKTESKAAIPFEVKFGEEYYVRCNLQMGVFVGEPNL